MNRLGEGGGENCWGGGERGMNRSTRLYSGLGGMGAGHGGSKYEIRGVKKEKAKKTRLEKKFEIEIWEGRRGLSCNPKRK